jgi:hypothetical protein
MGEATRSGRAVMAVLGALLAFAAPGSASAPGARADTTPVRFKTIKVDVSPLLDKGLAPEASWLAQDLPAALRTAFAGQLVSSGSAAPTLVVRIDGLFLGASGGGGTGPYGTNVARDNIEGAATIVAADGRAIATYPLFSTLLNETGGSTRELGSSRRRATNLASSFAYWLPRQMGL